MPVRLRHYGSSAGPLVIIFCAVLLAVPFTRSAQPQGKEPIASMAEIESRADFGDISAQQKLFDFLSQGDPAARGYDQALSWLRSAASRDDPEARFLLGYLYEHGRGLPRDYVKAAENYEAAASLGHSSAQSNLAVLYCHGLGVQKDLARAFRLYLAAAEQRNPVAQ